MLLSWPHRLSRLPWAGTLSYIFNSFVAGKPFSEVVSQAKAQGFTEPDPRDDLAGMDVARKVTILARHAPEACTLGWTAPVLVGLWLSGQRAGPGLLCLSLQVGPAEKPSKAGCVL